MILHLGNDEWAVVDSCVDTDSKRPVALEYLEQLGVDAAERVSLIVATHWHDDHIKGLGELFETCKRARFACSMALSGGDWRTLVSIYRSHARAGGSGVSEFGQVMRELERRARNREVVAPEFCITKKAIFLRLASPAASITCLAPSNAAVAVMQARIREDLLPKPNRRRLNVPALRENDASVVLAVKVGAASVLLGADLEERNRPGLGWQVILDEFPDGGERFDGFKISHHGSENGYHPDTWSRLMKPDALAAVTPFNRLKEPLPKPADCARILTMTERAYITAPPGLGKFRHSDAAVQRTMQEATLAIGQEPGKQGHIRFRIPADRKDGDWSVELFGHALHLKDLIHTE